MKSRVTWYSEVLGQLELLFYSWSYSQFIQEASSHAWESPPVGKAEASLRFEILSFMFKFLTHKSDTCLDSWIKASIRLQDDCRRTKSVVKIIYTNDSLVLSS